MNFLVEKKQVNEVSKVIAIDGPSGSGKSTIAKMVAAELSLIYLDTGAMFRALGYILNQTDIDLTQPVLNEAESSKMKSILENLTFEYGVNNDILIRIDGEDLTQKIREHEVSGLASLVSKYGIVRDYLKIKQREIVIDQASVLEGRDIGTVVFPNAALKIFLTADAQVRALRRYEQLIEKDEKNRANYSVKQILNDIEQRDKQDKERAIAPLIRAHDAIEIDTSFLDITGVKSKIIDLFMAKKSSF